MSAQPYLMDYATGDRIRRATVHERMASILSAIVDNAAGVIEVGGRECYVEPQGDDEEFYLAHYMGGCPEVRP